MNQKQRWMMAIPALALVGVTIIGSQGRLDAVCPSSVAGLRSGVVTVTSDAVLITGADGTSQSWGFAGAQTAFSDGDDGVVASNGTSLIHGHAEGQDVLHDASHLLLGTGDDTTGRWWAFAAVSPGVFAETGDDDASTILAAFPLEGSGEPVRLGWASGPEFGMTHLSASAGTVVTTSIEDLGEMIAVHRFDGSAWTEVEGFVSEPVEYNTAPFVLAAALTGPETIAWLEAPEQTEASKTTTWVVREADARSGVTIAEHQIGPLDGERSYAGLVVTTDGVLVVGDGAAWLVGGGEVTGRCIVGRVSDVKRP